MKRTVVPTPSKRNPWPAIVAVTVVSALVLMLGWALGEVVALRDDLSAAEDSLAHQTHVADAGLSVAWLAQAVHAAEDGDQGRSEVLAAHSLRLMRSPEALGIFARWGRREHPALVLDRRMGDCDRLVLAPSGGRSFCVTDHAVDVLDERGESEWHVPVEADEVYVDHRGEYLLLYVARGALIVDVPGRLNRAVPPYEPSPRQGRSNVKRTWLFQQFSADREVTIRSHTRMVAAGCAQRGGIEVATMVAQDTVLAVCADGSLVRLEGGTQHDIMQAIDGAGMGWTMAADPAGRTVVIGTLGGEVTWLDLERGEVLLRESVSTDQIGGLAVSDDGMRIAASAPGRGTWVWELAHVEAPLRLPHDSDAISFVDSRHLVTTVGTRLMRYDLPRHLSSHTHHPDVGGVVALDWRGDTLGVATGGVITRRVAGRWHTPLPVPAGKDVIVREDGEVWGAHLVGPETLGGDGIRSVRARRIGELSSGHVLVATGRSRPSMLSKDGEPVEGTAMIGSQAVDMSVSPDGATALQLLANGVLLRVDDGEPPAKERLMDLGSGRLAVGPGAAWFAVGHDDGVDVYDGDSGQRTRTLYEGSDIVSITVSGDGRLVAAADRARIVRVWDVASGELLLQVRTHDQRVAALAFSDDNTMLTTGSWDTSIHDLDLRVLTSHDDLDPERIEAKWGLDLEAALRVRGVDP